MLSAALGLILMRSDASQQILARDELRPYSAKIESETNLGRAAKAALKRSIGDSRIVMLGETTHGDGTAFALKTSLVKFLHQEMGFDVLVWESGFYDCAEMDRELAGDKPIAEVARMGVFDHWSGAAESLPVFEYARSTQGGPRRLQMAGFDIQQSGTASNYMLPEMVGWFEGRLREETKARIDSMFEAVRKAMPETFDKAYRDALLIPKMLLEEFERTPFSLNRAWGDQAAFRLQALRSAAANQVMQEVAVQGQPVFKTAYNLREQGNAVNLLWFAREGFKGKKLIVWAHNVHIFKGLPGLGAGVGLDGELKELDSTGRMVAKELGKDVYALGVVARSGRWSWRGGAPIDFTPAKPGSLEALLKPHVAPLGFVDLRGLPAGHRLRRPSPAAMDRQNHFELSTVWPDGFDGLLYIDEMQPRTQLQPK